MYKIESFKYKNGLTMKRPKRIYAQEKGCPVIQFKILDPFQLAICVGDKVWLP